VEKFQKLTMGYFTVGLISAVVGIYVPKRIFFSLDLEQRYSGSDLVLNHPNGVNTLFF
jgi:hypothetical protein